MTTANIYQGAGKRPQSIFFSSVHYILALDLKNISKTIKELIKILTVYETSAQGERIRPSKIIFVGSSIGQLAN